MTPATRTPEEALNWFRRTGTSVADWAAAHGFEPTVVYALLNRRTRGHRGKAHLAAIALGLKSPPDSSAASAAREDNQPRSD